MELRDLVVTPLIVFLVYGVAFVIYPVATNNDTRKYFFPAMTLKMIGAVLVGVLYQFYYGEGDTLAFHRHGSREIWNAFVDSPIKGVRLFLTPNHPDASTYSYASRMWYTSDAKSLVVIRLAFIFDLFTFSSYSATAVLFSALSFIGGWLLFLTFYQILPEHKGWLAFAILFLPSIIFWGSGLLKDTVTLAFLGIATYCLYGLFIKKKGGILEVILLLISVYVLFSVRKFILQAYLPSVILWVMVNYLSKVRDSMLKILLIPLLSIFIVSASFYAIVNVGKGDSQYSLDKISQTAKTTAYDIRFWTGKDAGSGYYLGELDGSFESLIVLAPQAINVTLFRPYLWEVKNPLMLVSAVESLFLLIVTLYFLFKCRSHLSVSIREPTVIFCLCFSLAFSFAVGVSTFNFGTLARYKIPAIPFYLVGLIMFQKNKGREQIYDQ
jgi:hypothetical protein